MAVKRAFFCQTGKARSRRSLGPNFKTKIVIQAMGIRMYSSLGPNFKTKIVIQAMGIRMYSFSSAEGQL
jgi:hypothetical protein